MVAIILEVYEVVVKFVCYTRVFWSVIEVNWRFNSGMKREIDEHYLMYH